MRALSRALAAYARRGRAAACDQRGFTLIEVLVAATVLVTGLVGLIGLLDISVRTASLDRVRQAENSLARQTLEDARSLAYTQLTPTALATALAAKVPNATASGSSITVTRAGTSANDSFSVALNACSLDDPSDGYGSHTSGPTSGGTWCPDVTTTGTTDTQPDDLKRVTATVTQTAGQTRNPPSVEQAALIYNPGPSLPAITCLTATVGTCPQGSYAVNHLVTPTLTFNVTASSTPYQIEWLVNGNGPGSALPSGASDPYSPSLATSTFNWTVPTTAGTYTISAVPLDSSGDTGNSTSLVVTVS